MLEKITNAFKRNKGIFLLVLGISMGIILVFSDSGGSEIEGEINHSQYIEDYISKTEERLEALIEKIEGASSVNVLVTLKSGSEYVYASDASEISEKHVVVSGDLVYVKEYLPEIEGVAVVCQGGNDPSVNAKITELVCSVTGLYTTHVYVTE